jgi:UDP-N-acetylmuramoylalanine--D-glutamate ligase
MAVCIAAVFLCMQSAPFLGILGAGTSGIAAAKLAAHQGANAVVIDTSMTIPVSTQEELEGAGILFIAGQEAERFLQRETFERIITSPGIAPHAPLRAISRARNLALCGELQFAWEQTNNPCIAITGTNGKTTTTTLIEHLLRMNNRNAMAVGNIGVPLSQAVMHADATTTFVIEASSYQLDTVTTFAPDIAIILNITPDHLSYHGSFANYVTSKWKIFANQKPTNTLILNADDAHAANAASVARSMVRYMSTSKKCDGAFVWGDNIMLSEQQQEEIVMPVRKLGLPGVHNQYNSMAALVAARAVEIHSANIRSSLETFQGVEHRLEVVGTFRDVQYVNDSKATNVNATWYALGSYDKPIVWIAGGRGDNNDYDSLNDVVERNVAAIVCIGEEQQSIFNHWCTKKRCVKADTLLHAVEAAAAIAQPHSVVLFSPACKSFDMFTNFEHRGETFKRLVGHHFAQ